MGHHKNLPKIRTPEEIWNHANWCGNIPRKSISEAFLKACKYTIGPPYDPFNGKLMLVNQGGLTGLYR